MPLKSYVGASAVIVLLYIFASTPSISQTPSDNPYKTFYNVIGYHWTDSIAWGNVFNVMNYGVVADGVTDNLSAIQAGMQAVAAAGGGVLYFPPGRYFVSDTLRLISGVVLRGANPVGGTAKDSTFQLPSKLLFPKYEPNLSGNGTPNSTAFRTIELATGNEKNVGLVNLDINRAGISMHPKFAISSQRPRISVGGGVNNADNWQPITNPHNIVIMGIRSNNVAIPDPGIPQPQQHPWQRFCWRFAANIDVTGIKNVLVANCRVNDSITDSYKQPGYICRNCPNSTNNSWGPAPDQVKTDFNYADHYGISVNRAKLRVQNGSITIEPFHWYPIPSDEPLLFATGIEVLDNWVYSTMRIKITAAGWGLKVLRNIGKDTVNKTFFLTPNGQARQTNNSATYECRGIDFSGFDVEIAENDMEVNNGRFLSGFVSICGEGIMNQGNSGGSRINGVHMRKNIVRGNAPNNTNPAFTLYRLYNISNILIDSNVAIGNNQLMLIDADQTGAPQHLYNAHIAHNQVNSLRVRGSAGGKQVLVEGNRGLGVSLGGQTGASVLQIPCYADTVNNLGYLTQEACLGPFAGVIEVPAVVFANLSGKDSCITTSTTFQVTGLVQGAPDSVVLFTHKGRIAKANLSNNTFNYSWNVANDYGYHYLTAAVYKDSQHPITWAQTFKVQLNTQCTITAGHDRLENANKPQLLIVPNPASSLTKITVVDGRAPWHVQIFNFNGQLLRDFNIEENEAAINVSGWSKGIYIVKAQALDGQRHTVQKLVVE